MPCSRPGRLWSIRFGQGGNGFRRQRIDADRAGDVFDALLTAILEGESQSVADLLAHCPRDADASLSARLSKRAAIFTASPNRSRSSTMTSPRLITIRNRMRLSSE